MGSLEKLLERSGSKCELCKAADNLSAYDVPPDSFENPEKSILTCKTCREQIENPEKLSQHHWHCLSESMWSETEAVKVVAWRMLNHLKTESWAQDLLDMLYLEDEILLWAKAFVTEDDKEETTLHRDSNGAPLTAGDSVTLIKDLNVKGAGFTAKRGTIVRGITPVQDNSEQIEGRVNGQQIIILTRFIKKVN